MRILLVSLCSLALVSMVCGAQKDQKKSQPKKQAQTAQRAAQPAKPAGGSASGKKTSTATRQPQNNRTGRSPAAVNNTQQVKRNQSSTAVNQGQKSRKNESVARNQGQQGRKGQTSNAADQTQKNKQNQTQVQRRSQNANEREAARTANAGKVKNNANNATGQNATKGKVAKNNKPVKPRHFNLAKQPNTSKAPPVKFQQGRRIQGSQNWQGQKYAVFRNYQSQWHDQGWWRHHYGNNIVFVFGAPYYWNAGYWFPAWGYNPNAYYAWDGPIYGYNRMPPDQVIANVQAELQQQGYYHGDVDGLIGPLTRGAIADYQRDHGLYTTSTIDQPTLQSLGIS
jgi:putative peptidoglycan binding protein